MLTRLFAATLLVFGFAVAAQAEEKPNDAQIAHIAYTAGQIDIAAAKQALKKSKNAKVIDFAKQMERDHAAVNKEALTLLKKLGVEPQDNPTSQALSKQAKAERAKLAQLQGAAFDKAYVSNEVAYHKAVNAALNDTLIPSAENVELKDLLKQGLTLFTEHQHHAEMLAASME